MRISTATLATVLATTQVAHGKTTYGCWSDSGSKFHNNCVIAYTSLVAFFTELSGNTDRVALPRAIYSAQYGNCKAQITGKNGGSVNFRDLISSFDQLAARCQHGYFYYDDGWVNANIEGRAGWRRDEENSKDDGKVIVTPLPDTVQLPEGGDIQWETAESPVLGPLLADTASSDAILNRAHAKALVVRANPVGEHIRSGNAGRNSYDLYRSSAVRVGGMTFYNVFVNLLESRANDLIDRAVTDGGHGILRTGIEQEVGASVRVLALAMELGGGFTSWNQLFNSMGDGGNMVLGMVALAMGDVIGDRLTAGVYHLYNRQGTVVLSFILNGVAGTGSSLPSS